MNIYPTRYENVESAVREMLTYGRTGVIYGVAESNWVIAGVNEQLNESAVEQAGIPVLRLNHEGGCIVVNPGDIDIGLFTERDLGNKIKDGLIQDLAALLQEKGYTSIIERNDLMVEGRKVMGFGSRMFLDILYTAIHISVNMNLELIESICTKPMEKVPGGLSDYGVTTQEVVNILLSRLKMYE